MPRATKTPKAATTKAAKVSATKASKATAGKAPKAATAKASRVTAAKVSKASSAKGKGDEIEGDVDVDSRAIFEEDVEAILSVVQSGALGSSTTTKLIGIETIQKCLDVLTERLDFTVQNSIPVPVPLSEVLRNSIMRRQEFIKNDYDKAVTEKILMVLVNSEGLAKKRFGEPSVAEAAEEDQDANLQKEQVAEEEVLKEQVRCSDRIGFSEQISHSSICLFTLGGGRRRGGGRGRRRGGRRRSPRSCQKEEVQQRRREGSALEGRITVDNEERRRHELRSASQSCQGAGRYH